MRNHTRTIRRTRIPPTALLCLLVLLALPAAALAKKPTPLALHLDPATASIRWTLDTTLHTVHGTFKLKSGEPQSFQIDPATGEASGLIVIDATSGESAEPARDRRMHAAVLESARYPTITFRPTHVDGRIDLAAPGSVTVSGILNLHGQDHPLQIAVALRPQSSTVALSTHFTVPFVAWGLKDPSTFVFRTAKQVAIDIDATVIPIPAGPVARPILRPGETHTGR